MKKEYMKPSVQVIELRSKQVIMAGSSTAPLQTRKATDDKETYDYEFN